MTNGQIDRLMRMLQPATPGLQPELVETHISWVILHGYNVYKIKKPIRLHFLDFSTLAKRKYYCEREIGLNRRLTEGIYLQVLAVKDFGDGPFFSPIQKAEPDASENSVIDYAVHMKRMDDALRMDKLVGSSGITDSDIDRLAIKIASFHSRAEIIYNKDPQDIPVKFADLSSEQEYLETALPSDGSINISRAVCISDRFSLTHRKRVEERIRNGFVRDCHGDLHTRNVFLSETPQPFDCIEFNDDIRQIDVLNEIAFLCMDLEALGRADLSERFLQTYRSHFPAFQTLEDEKLFIYYKSYRANIRAKINSLRSRTALTGEERKAAIAAAGSYLGLMNGYLRQLEADEAQGVLCAGRDLK